jgi:hypothetical protein
MLDKVNSAEINEFISSFNGLAEKLKSSPPLSKEFWKEQFGKQANRNIRHTEEKKSLKMSDEKYKKQFNL